MDPRELTGGFDTPRGTPQPCILDRKRPVARFPDSFSSNLGRKASSFFSQEDSASGVDKNYPSPPPIPESKSVLHRKRDVIPGLPSPHPLPRNRQISTVSSVKAIVAKFESAGDALEKSDKMADHEDHHLIPSSPVVDKHKDKASFADDADTSAASPQTFQPPNIGEGKSDNSDVDLELLKMQEFFKGEPLARCLEDYIPPTYIDKKTKILPLEKDCGKSMEKAAKVELWNKLASLTDTLEAQYPSVKEEREAKHAVISAAAAYLEEALGESPKKLAQVVATQTSTKASRRAEKKAQKKADKKAQKAAKLDNSIANTLAVASSSMNEQVARDEPSLREKYPEIFAKIDYWRSLPDPDAPADVDGDYTSIADIDSSQSNDQPIDQSINQPVSKAAVEEAQSIPKQRHNTLSTKVEDDKTLADDSSESDNWSTGSSNGDPFYLNKYLTPSYQAAAKVFLEDFERKNPTQPITKSTVQQALPEATECEESFKFVQRDPKELSDTEETKKDKAIEAEKKRIELNKRSHERVDAAHADGNIVHCVNYKSARDAVETNIKKEDIVPSFGQKKQPAPEFDEEAYATRSIASHTLKPAPLRLPSRMKKPFTGSDKIDVKSTTPTQAKTPLPPGALSVNTNKYRMVTGDFATLGVGFGKTSNRIASGSSTHSSRGAVNFSWPKAQHADAKNKYEFNDDDDSDYDMDKKSNTLPTKLNTSVQCSDSVSVHPRIVSAGGRAREMHKDGDAFDNKSAYGHYGSAASATAQSKGSSQNFSYTPAQPNTTSSNGNDEEKQRRSFTADEYQTLIQEDYDAFAKDSPEKKQKRLEDAMTGSKTGSSMRTTEVTSNITHHTVVVPAHHQGFTVRLPNATALPPTPATSHAPMTTGEKMAELDDFFSEENDHRYTTTRTNTGSTYSSDYGDGAGTSVQDQVHDQPWNDADYHEEALSYGYAYKQTNYHALPHSVNPVPLTHEQRHQVLKSYGIPADQYPAPPIGYPNPPGPDEGSKAPPCPIRAAPVAPTTLSAAEGGGDGAGRRVDRSSADDGAAVESLRKHRRFRRAATAPPAPAPVSPAPGYDADWF
ncbi:uncharacterized protein LY79DRAFT_517286 [Colletotrichum navitas]|uniref:Uncharacterized protein n=1 Tax=Colletotrichum navitas TaxID=681940 RepID=A0AAD8PXV3_9PEZI|nr:uncharacterized protein LY79DRAFT_517286 [Colletotrichum navitas]KAK1589612.1 hypothetical protein LY79DRAFT_517286 [Colletotrichum navitas]